jgi:cephalosporin-C deacetylase
MAFFDLPLEQLLTFKAPDTEPADFEGFWDDTLADAARHDLAAAFVRIDDPSYQLVEAYDVSFRGFGGQEVKGWFVLPAQHKGKLPCIVTYIGYGGGRGFPIDHLAPAVAGFAHFVMDTRGQGSGWAPGATADQATTGPQFPGFMTNGIDSPQNYYYRRVFTDAVRAVEAAAGHPAVDPARIAVTGVSQGGGITIAAAGLCGRKVKLAMPEVPYLCYYRRATTLVDSMPYNEIVQYLKCHRDKVEQTFQTLAYFDGLNFAPRITARCLFSIGLMDTVCPPSTVFAAYNRIKAKKEYRTYEFNNHEGGGVYHALERLRFAAKYL